MCPLCKDKNSFSLISSGTRQLLRDLSADWTSRWVIYFPLYQLISHPALPWGPCSFIPLTTLTFGNVLPWLIFTLYRVWKLLKWLLCSWLCSLAITPSYFEYQAVDHMQPADTKPYPFLTFVQWWNQVIGSFYCMSSEVCAVKCTCRFSVFIWDLAWRVQCGLILRKQQEEACHRLVHFHTLTLIGRACIASRLQRHFCVLFLDVELFEICCYHWTAQSGWCELARFASEPQTN